MGLLRFRRGLSAAVVAAAVVAVSGTTTAVASGHAHKVFVSASGRCDGHRAYSTIAGALADVPAWGTVKVCAGTYNEDVVVHKPVRLVGHHATVNPSSPVVQTNSPLYAQAGNNGFTIAARWVTVRGFTVTGASGDGIFSFGNHSRIMWNHSTHNGSTGISLNGSSYSFVRHNWVAANSAGGITLANDAGSFFPGATASHDHVLGNVVTDNPLGCGIILADHLGSTVQGGKGIFDNVIKWNWLRHNGTGLPGQQGGGGGVLLASPVPGGSVYDNLVSDNTIRTSGLGGVTIHSHIPGQNFSGNRITWNRIGRNNLLGDFADAQATGIYIGSVDRLRVVVRHNRIGPDHYGIFTAGAVRVSGLYHNVFHRVAVRLGHVSAYTG